MEGTFISHLAGVKAGAFLSIPQLSSGISLTPAFQGTVDEFIASHVDGADRVVRMLRNRVKKCESCGKPNAFTLAICNGCGHSLTDTVISFSPNVFMGFVFGVARCPFPLTVSVRAQGRDFLVMDDLLALSPLHFNVIPTTAYIPDWRYLLRRPSDGLQLIQQLLERCHVAANENFLQNEAWVRQFVRAGATFSPVAHVACGFNYPPSQYQLHIQYIAPMMLPFQHAQFQRGVHFTAKRFFPFAYVASCLAVLRDRNEAMPPHLLEDKAPIEDIIKYFLQTHSIDYDSYHSTFLADFSAHEREFSNWRAEDFEGVVVAGPFGERFLQTGSSVAGGTDSFVGRSVKAVIDGDKLELQNYGRPYVDGKPQGSFYAFPKQPAEIEMW